MNFEDLKKEWDNESSDGFSTPTEIGNTPKPKHPLDVIRANMRCELICQIVAIVFMGAFPFIMKMGKEFYTLFYILYFFILVISGYYLFRFSKFFKQISVFNLSSIESLYEIYYGLRINMEMYKTFTFSLTPFVTIIILMATISARSLVNVGINSMPTNEVVLIIATCLILITVIALGTHIWVEHFYGRYARQIKRLIDEIKEE